jgi:hypothetical protein
MLTRLLNSIIDVCNVHSSQAKQLHPKKLYPRDACQHKVFPGYLLNLLVTTLPKMNCAPSARNRRVASNFYCMNHTYMKIFYAYARLTQRV